MKTIGIIGAMEEETAKIKSAMDVVNIKNIVGLDFYLGLINGAKVVLVRSGIGKVNAAVCAQTLINLYGVDLIINTGAAGALAEELEIGDVVISSDLVQHDFDAAAFGDEPGMIPRLNIKYFPADGGLISLAEERGKAAPGGAKIYIGRIASGDQFISDPALKARIWKTFRSLCVDMEGAAIAQTCFLNKLPFLAIRCVSDKADGAANESFEKFLLQSAENSANIVLKMIDKL